MRTISGIVILFLSFSQMALAKDIVIGSKAFTEGYLMGELLAQTLESAGHGPVHRRLGMGGTGILFTALNSGEIDAYVEYTGTIAEAILKQPQLNELKEIEAALAHQGLVMSRPLGFNNTYALAVPVEYAKAHGLKKISDLQKVISNLRTGFSFEFMNRQDGYPALIKAYDLKLQIPPTSLEHSLAYEAIRKNEIDLLDVYSTDAKIEKLNLVVLEDDRKFFPNYFAVVLARKAFVDNNPLAWTVLQNLSGQINAATMIRLNAAIDIDKGSFAVTISKFLGRNQSVNPLSETRRAQVLKYTKEHITLVGIALLFSIVLGVPLGILASMTKFLAQGILLISGLIQTIPSLALLCFLIPLFGIGNTSALVALFLYGLLPVVNGTFVGLRSIEPIYNQTAEALGLSPWQKLWRIDLPLASRSILGGIRTSATIGIGTATLAALIGAGGYGVPIVTGLAINDLPTILQGAIPAALLAIVTQLIFEWLERFLIPRGLRISQQD